MLTEIEKIMMELQMKKRDGADKGGKISFDYLKLSKFSIIYTVIFLHFYSCVEEKCVKNLRYDLLYKVCIYYTVHYKKCLNIQKTVTRF